MGLVCERSPRSACNPGRTVIHTAISFESARPAKRQARQATFTSGTNAGIYLLATAATGAERGNSYRVWQDATHVRIYENASNSYLLV